MEAKMDNMLATVSKFFKVERMKMPPSLLNTLMADLISGKPIFIFYRLTINYILFRPICYIALCQNYCCSVKVEELFIFSFGIFVNSGTTADFTPPRGNHCK